MTSTKHRSQRHFTYRSYPELTHCFRPSSPLTPIKLNHTPHHTPLLHIQYPMVDFSQAPKQVTDSFDVHVNILLRAVIALVVGVWGWALNLQIMSIYGIDVDTVLKLPWAKPTYRPVYRLALFLTFILGLWIVLFWFTLAISNVDATKNSALTILDIFPWIALGVFFAAMGVGVRSRGSGRGFFLWSLRRVSIGGLDKEHRITDVILSDALTSYSRVIADVAICVYMGIMGITTVKRPERGIGGNWFVPFVTCIPYLIRLRQCLIDYSRDGRRFHLVNALKYCSTLPVLGLGAFMKTNPGAHNLWLVAALTNSTFSFIWDIKCDWNLSLVQDLWDGQLNNGGLRPILTYPKLWYYGAILADLVLRFTWILKFTSSFGHVHDYETGIFVFQLLEVFRRWMWVFFRVDNEWTKAIGGTEQVNKKLEQGIQLRPTGEHED